MNKIERIKMILAMEFIARQINDEFVFNRWITFGIPDGDIPYGELNALKYDDDYFIEDERFAELMEDFLICMKRAYKIGGLYCDGILNGVSENEI